MNRRRWQALIAALLLLCLTAAQAAEYVTYYHLDAAGTPVAATDETGQVTWREEYQPYGKRILNEDTGASRRGFTGKPDNAFGINYFGARWYDPQTGRFMGVDPVDFVEGNPQSFNGYLYANNNPYKYVDPDGRFPLIPLAIGIALEAGNLFFEVHDTVNNPCGDCVRSSGAGIPGGAGVALEKSISKKAVEEVTKRVEVSSSKYPEAANHIKDAQSSGHPSTLTIDRAGAAANRKEALQGVPTRKGLDRDEYPPAMFKEGGSGSSVRHINPSQNRGAGSCIGAQCGGLPSGTRVKIDVVD